jgi:hypothetical protein
MALHFNSDSGTDDYLNKSVAIFSGHTYPLAFTAWVRPDDRGSQHAICSDSGSGTGKQIRLGASSGGKFQMGMRGGTATTSGAHYDNGNTTWFHILGSLVGYWPLGGPYAPTTIGPVGSNTLTANGGASVESHPKIIYPMPPPAVMVAAGGQAVRAMHHYRMLRCS